MLSETKQNPCLPFRSLFATPRAAYTEPRGLVKIRQTRMCRIQMQACEYQLLFKRLLLLFFFRRNHVPESREESIIYWSMAAKWWSSFAFLRARVKKKNVRSFIYIVCRFEKSCDATIRRRFLVCLSDANFVSRALSTKYAISLSVVQKIMAVIP